MVWFREQIPRGRVETQEVCVDLERGYARYRAVVEDGEGGMAMGYGTETAAGFADYVERAETRALGRALAVLGFGTQYVGTDLTEGEHIVDAPVARLTSVTVTDVPIEPAPAAGNGEASRLTADQARELKQLAQTAFGYRDGERRLRADLGFEPDEKLTLRHIAAHTPVARYTALVAMYQAALRGAEAVDVP